MYRIFVALPIAPETRVKLTALQSGIPGARWIDADNFHVTLRFLGNADTAQIGDLDAALNRIAGARFAMDLSGVGHFGTDRRPQTLWAGIERSDPLRQLRDRVDRAAVAADFEPDSRKFAPHVALARLKSAPADRVARWLSEHALFRAGPLDVDRFILFRSHMGRAGATYEPLADYPLR